MRRFIVFILPLLLTITLTAQKISVKDFKIVTNDLTARVTAPVIDQNGDKCALIKVITDQKGFVWEGDMLGIVETDYKIGEHWLYVPYGAKYLTIRHEKLGALRNYKYPMAIKKATAYELHLTTASVLTTVEEREIPTQWVIFTSEPKGADVYVDDEYKDVTDYQVELEEGKHTYRIEKPLHHTYAGVINPKADGEKVEVHAKLEPNYGFASFTTNPANGTITIKGENINKESPFTTDRLKSGDYQVTVSKNLYHDTTITITIRDNETTEIETKLRPAFASLYVKSTPESKAEIFVDNKSTGKKTPATISPISSGKHTITLRKEWFEPKKEQIVLGDDEQKQLQIEMKPTFGNVIVQTSKGADIYIDNKKVGTNQWEGRLAAGFHTFEARMNKHHNDQKKKEITIGDEFTINLESKPKNGTLKVITQPFGAEIYIDGIRKATAPHTFNDLLIGQYSVKIVKAGFGTITQQVKIKEGETTTIDEKLESATVVSIKSPQKGAEVFIDGKSIGKTPLEKQLSFGKHSVVVQKGDYITREQMNVSNDNTKFDFFLRPKKHFYLMYAAAITVPNTQASAPIGLHVGMTGKWGFYGSACFNGDFSASSDFSADGPDDFNYTPDGKYYDIESKELFPHLTLTAGANLRISSAFYFYGGAGYGYRKRYFQAKEYTYPNNFERDVWIEHKQDSHSGVVAEGGAMIRTKWLIFSVGLSTIGFQTMNINVGAGFNL